MGVQKRVSPTEAKQPFDDHLDWGGVLALDLGAYRCEQIRVHGFHVFVVYVRQQRQG
jgi:hypothetical protein